MLKRTSAITAALATITGVVAITHPAEAVSAYGCPWPRVCFYKEYSNVLARQPTTAFRDMTSYWQWLGPGSRYAYMAYNSRNDDGARLLYQDGSAYCLGPNSVRSNDRSYANERVVAVRIMHSPVCAIDRINP
jgi:hypothetical protein